MPTVWRSTLPDIDPTPTLVHEEIFGRARRWPERAALIDAGTGRALSYGELTGAARRLAGGLRARGARPGDVLALVAGNSPEFAVVLYGALAAGLAVAPANPLLTARELAGVLGRVGARYLVADTTAWPAATKAAAGCGMDAAFALGAVQDAATVPALLEHEPLPPEGGDVGATALLFTTSGTSGLPKSAAHSHAGTVAGTRQFDVPWMRLGAGDTVSGMLMLAHVMGTIMLHHTLRSGAVFVTVPPGDPDRLLAAIERYRVTLAIGPPPMARMLAHHPLVDRYDVSSLRKVGIGAAPLPVADEAACARRLGCSVAQGYGMTEAWTLAMTAREPVRGSAGELVAGSEAVVVDPQRGDRLDAGQIGEVWARGPQLMTGYAGDPEAGAATVDADGWLHTGDLGRFDDEGNLFLVDRVKELIKHRGYQVAPAELEAELTAHPAVADAAVVARPHPEAGEVPVAYVALRAPVEGEALAKWLSARVAPWKQVWEVVTVDQVPRSPTGKLLRRRLAEQERAAGRTGQAPAGAVPAGEGT